MAEANQRTHATGTRAGTVPGMAQLVQILWRPSDSRFDAASDLPVDALQDRLGAALDANNLVQGKVANRGIKVECRPHHARSHGTFSPIFYGVIRSTDGGSRLTGHFQLHPVVRLFLAVWFTGTILIALTFLIASLTNAGPDASRARTALDALPVLVLSLLPGVGLLIVRWQQARARTDESALRQWLAEATAST